MSTLYYETDYLEHHGIKGQKWGVRSDSFLKAVDNVISDYRKNRH